MTRLDGSGVGWDGVKEKLAWRDRVMKIGEIRNFWTFTRLESFGYLWRKSVVHGKYHPFLLDEELNHHSLTEMCIRCDQDSWEC